MIEIRNLNIKLRNSDRYLIKDFNLILNITIKILVSILLIVGIYVFIQFSNKKLENEDKIKLMILKEKWKELFLELSQNSSVIDFKENTIYIKGYNSVVKHYIFANKIKLIEKILENLKIRFEISDIKVK